MCDIPPSQPFSLGVALFPLTLCLDHRRRSASPSVDYVPLVACAPPPSECILLIKIVLRSQEITTDAKYRGICHIARRRARNCDNCRDKWCCSRAGTGYFGLLYLMDTRHVELAS